MHSVSADTWALPKKEKYYSPNKKYYLEVMPKKLESQLKYFEDKVEGRGNAGAQKKVKDNRAKGAFYARRDDGSYSKKWEFPLVNEVSPVNAVISSNGDYAVTFDNWHSAGYGDDVAKAAHAESAVIVELLVSKTGDVICVRTLSGHPLLRAAALAAVRKWKFQPIEVAGSPMKVISTVVINFKLTEKDVNPNNQPRN